MLLYAAFDLAALAVEPVQVLRDIEGARRVVGDQALYAEGHVGQATGRVEPRTGGESQIETGRALRFASGHAQQRRDARLHLACADAPESLRDEDSIVAIEPYYVGYRS